MKNQFFTFFIENRAFLFRRKELLIIAASIMLLQNAYSLKSKKASSNGCRKSFSFNQTIQYRNQLEREFILDRAATYHGPKGYEQYIQEHPNSPLASKFQAVLSLFSKEELELLEWHYIEFDSMKFAKINRVVDGAVFVDYIDNGQIKTQKLSRMQFNTIEPSSIAQGRIKFKEALGNKEFIGDNRYISIPSLYLSDTYARVLEVHQGNITAEVIGYDGKIRKTQLPSRDFFKTKIDPVSKMWFNRIEQSTPVLESSQTVEENLETALVNQGYKKALVYGVNEINRQIKLGERIRQLNINPFSAHIVDFVPQIPIHIETVKQGIQSQNIEVRERLELLEQFELEASQKIKEEAVTYTWWIFWNKRLSILATPSYQREEKEDWWKSKENTEHLLENLNEEELTQLHKDEHILLKMIQQFPDRLAFPTASHLGLMAFNQSSLHSIFPIQLTGKDQWMDGELNTPEMAFSHDMNHALLQSEQRESSSSISMRKFYQQAQASNSLTTQEREVIEIVYFLIEHEDAWADIARPNTVLSMLTDKDMQDRFRDSNDFGSWIKEDMADKSIHSYLHKMAKTFNRAASSVLKNQ